MTFIRNTAATAIALGLMLGGSSAAFAKAHDQGVADGLDTPDSTSAFIQTLQGPGVSMGIKNGQRGTGASTAGGDNAVEPVVGNGANEPD